MGSSWITGVCVRSGCLEWTILRRVKESWEVASQGSEVLAPVSEDGTGGWTAAALKPYIKQFHGRLSIALPGDRLLLRMTLLPSTDAEELWGMAELQTDRFSPFPVDTVAEGAEVLKTSDASSLTALAVVQHETVAEAGQPFLDLKALPDLVDVEPLAWWWCLQQAGAVPSLGTHVILRATKPVTDMMVVVDGALLLSRSLPAWPADDAVEDAESAAAPSQQAWMEECAEELTYSLTEMETEWGNMQDVSLHVFTDRDAPVDWVQQLQEQLGFRADAVIRAVNELPRVSEGVARRLLDPADILAMDLTPADWREADAAKRQKIKFLRMGTGFLVVWLLLLGIFLGLLSLQRSRLARLSKRVDVLEAPANEVRRLRARVANFRQYADRSRSALECLRMISASLPRGMDLTQLQYRKNNGTLFLRGESDATEKIYDFMRTMEQMELFTEIKLESINTRVTPQGRREQFVINIYFPGEDTGGDS